MIWVRLSFIDFLIAPKTISDLRVSSFYCAVLYESGSLVHGRPFALKGKGAHFANIFIHFVSLYYYTVVY